MFVTSHTTECNKTTQPKCIKSKAQKTCNWNSKLEKTLRHHWKGQAILSHHAAIMNAMLTKKKKKKRNSPWTLTPSPSQGAYSTVLQGNVYWRAGSKIKNLGVLTKNPTYVPSAYRVAHRCQYLQFQMTKWPLLTLSDTRYAHDENTYTWGKYSHKWMNEWMYFCTCEVGEGDWSEHIHTFL